MYNNDTNKVVSSLPGDVQIEPALEKKRTELLTKFLATLLFIAMPFIGGGIGYQYALLETALVEIHAPIKVIEKGTVPVPPETTSKQSAQLLAAPLQETDQIKFDSRYESVRQTEITFVPNRNSETPSSTIKLQGYLSFMTSDFSGTWVGYFTPDSITQSILPTGEPDGMPKYFYIVDPKTVMVLCEKFDCTNYTQGLEYKAMVSFTPQEIMYETVNIGFDSYPKTITFSEIDIISQSN